jgi:hypothetical protein
MGLKTIISLPTFHGIAKYGKQSLENAISFTTIVSDDSTTLIIPITSLADSEEAGVPKVITYNYNLSREMQQDLLMPS